jgi:hypothetical protein
MRVANVEGQDIKRSDYIGLRKAKPDEVDYVA